MNRRRPKPQLSLPFESTIAPPTKREPARIYQAVMYFRGAGLTCYRAGWRKHLLDGRVVSSLALCRRAGIGFVPIE